MVYKNISLGVKEYFLIQTLVQKSFPEAPIQINTIQIGIAPSETKFPILNTISPVRYYSTVVTWKT